MQIVLSGNRVVARGDNCFLCMGGTVICEDTGKAYQNATLAEVEAVPVDIDTVGYEYHAGVFVPCAPYGAGAGSVMVACEDCGTPKRSKVTADADGGLDIPGYLTGGKIADDTAGALGLESGATVDDALNTLNNNAETLEQEVSEEIANIAAEVAKPQSPYTYLGEFNASGEVVLSIDLSSVDWTTYKIVKLCIHHERTQGNSTTDFVTRFRVNNQSGKNYAYKFYYNYDFASESYSSDAYISVPSYLQDNTTTEDYEYFVVDLHKPTSKGYCNVDITGAGQMNGTPVSLYAKAGYYGYSSYTPITSFQVLTVSTTIPYHKIHGTVWGCK